MKKQVVKAVEGKFQPWSLTCGGDWKKKTEKKKRERMKMNSA
jgi:hypothetical protein